MADMEIDPNPQGDAASSSQANTETKRYISNVVCLGCFKLYLTQFWAQIKVPMSRSNSRRNQKMKKKQVWNQEVECRISMGVGYYRRQLCDLQKSHYGFVHRV